MRLAHVLVCSLFAVALLTCVTSLCSAQGSTLTRGIDPTAMALLNLT
jgi:hypothetical protein